MNKKIKKIIAITMAVGTISAVSPAKYFNLFTTQAYASSSECKLTDINVQDSSDNDVKLYEKSSYKDKLNSGSTLRKTYYGKVSSGRSKIKIDVDCDDSGEVRIFKDSSSKAYDKNDEISLSSGKNIIYINTYKDGTDEDDMKKTKKYENQYKLVIQRGSSDSDSDSDDDSNDSVYLDSISLNPGDIDFSKDKSSYNVKVGASVDEITIKARPDDEDEDSVTIDGHDVNEDDKWKRTVDLEKGKNTIKIVVEDNDDNKRTYTLNITRGNTASDNSSSSTSDSVLLDSLILGSTDVKISESRKEFNYRVDEKCKKIYVKAEPKDDDYTVTIDGDTVDDDDNYARTVSLGDEGDITTIKVKVEKDGKTQTYTLNVGRGDVPASKFPAISTGSTTTNTNTNNTTSENTSTSGARWVNDSSMNYSYIQADGTRATGWLDLNGQWYYLGTDGIRQTDWVQVSGQWYYMDPTTGAMRTGWFRSPYSGKDYYLNPVSNGTKGAMLTNTTIDGRRLGSDGAALY